LESWVHSPGRQEQPGYRFRQLVEQEQNFSHLKFEEKQAQEAAEHSPNKIYYLKNCKKIN